MPNPPLQNFRHSLPHAQKLGRLLASEFSASSHKFESGFCPEFALALNKSWPSSSLLVAHRHWKNEGEEFCTPLSHVVVQLGPHDFDATGDQAVRRWEARWEGDYSEKPDESVSFEWVEVRPCELIELVKKNREDLPEIDNFLVNSLAKKISEISSSFFCAAPPFEPTVLQPHRPVTPLVHNSRNYLPTR